MNSTPNRAQTLGRTSGPATTREIGMRSFKTQSAAGCGGCISVAAAILLFNTIAFTAGIYFGDPKLAEFVARCGTLFGVVVGGASVWYYITRCTPGPENAHFDPVAERDARARFMSTSDPSADDPSIQPDRRGLKPGDH
jgi:hypothetical protein